MSNDEERMDVKFEGCASRLRTFTTLFGPESVERLCGSRGIEPNFSGMIVPRFFICFIRAAVAEAQNKILKLASG
jgi:hypothetical protein